MERIEAQLNQQCESFELLEYNDTRLMCNHEIAG